MNKKINILLAITFFIALNLSQSMANKEPKVKTLMISGKIIDSNHNELLAGVSITSTNCEKTIYSDLNGNFFIYIKIKEEQNFKLEFSQIGYATKTLLLADLLDKSSNLEINLIEE